MDEEGEPCLPTEFLGDDLLHSGCEVTAEEEDHLAGLTREMTHFFLHEDSLELKRKDLAGSPHSIFSASGLSSPTSTGERYSEAAAYTAIWPNAVVWNSGDDNNVEDRWNFEEVDRLTASGHSPEDESLGKRRLSPPFPSNQNFAGYCVTQALIQPQLQAAAQYQYLMEQQHNFSSAPLTGKQRRRNSGDAGALPPQSCPPLRGWSPLQKPQLIPPPQSSMLHSGANRESAGTGVFLPRRPFTPVDTKKKPSFSSVLLPARVAQALNLNLDEFGVTTRYSDGFVLDHDALVKRSNNTLKRRSNNNLQILQQEAPQHGAAAVAVHEIRLPQEWTY